MGAPDNIKRLVDTFHNNLDSFKSGSYNETQVRREFIDPLFTSLGWDVDNKAGYAEAYKDVIHEFSLKTKDVTEAPDYCFRIGGTKKFFVEAKKPSINVKDAIHPSYQLRRYAWTAKLPLSILTDFEEFAVYDTRILPKKTDKASTGRIIFHTYFDYLDKWDEIDSIFSREAVLKGSFDKYVASNKKKKGTAEVDEVFLDQMEEWRKTIAKNIALRNPALTIRELNYAVQKTIDRIIFLRICEDRGIEDYGQLMTLLNGTNVYDRLKQIYYRADEKYNSGLFHFEKEKDRIEPPDNLTLDLSIDDKTIKDVIKNLYYPDSPYEFSVLPADILGQVYEQFLGKVIRLTPAHFAVVEDKPEVKKAGGVYYTPTYIVDYIVQNTLGRLISPLTQRGDEGGFLTPKQISKLKILDPACGSGSFLIGAYEYLLNYHLEYYDKQYAEGKLKTGNKNSPVYETDRGDLRLTTAEKKRILLNNIYGVDIDPQAVEVTKLSLLLKVLEGESEETLTNQMRMFRERALPDLSNNIKCGNSLIGPDFYDQMEMQFLDDEEKMRINVFDWNTEFKEIMSDGGFDVVIGNPPYVRIQRISKIESEYFFNKYYTLSSKTDISQIFIERAFALINGRGMTGFICTSQWLATDYGKLMREKMSEGFIKQIVNFGSLNVFKKVDTYPAIFIFSKYENKALEIKNVKSKKELNLKALIELKSEKVDYSTLNKKSWILSGFDLEAHLQENNIKWTVISNYGKSYIGALTGMDEAFVIDKNIISNHHIEQEILLPYCYRGNEIYKYRITKPGSFIIYPYKELIDGTSKLLSENEIKTIYPNAYNYLLNFKEKLKLRMDSRKLYANNEQWYRYLRPGSFNYINPEKLVVKGIDKKSVVGILPAKTAFNGANTPALILTRFNYEFLYKLLALLNSKLVSYYLVQICPDKLGGYKRFNSKNISAIPVPLTIENKMYDLLSRYASERVVLESKIIESKTPQERTTLQRQIEATDKQIDRLVYQLYGLTDDEIKIVEETTSS